VQEGKENEIERMLKRLKVNKRGKKTGSKREIERERKQKEGI
jgi:hypothetical protein